MLTGQVEWKLSRGKWRPLLRFAQAQVEADVVGASTEGLTELAKLQGQAHKGGSGQQGLTAGQEGVVGRALDHVTKLKVGLPLLLTIWALAAQHTIITSICSRANTFARENRARLCAL